MSTYIRPQSVGEILRNSARLYRSNFRVLFLAYLLPLSPFMVFYGFAFAVRSDALKVSALIVVTIVGLFSVVPITIILSDICLGNAPDLARAFRPLAGRSIFKLLGTYLLVLAITVGGLVLLVAPGIVFSLWFALAMPVVVIEQIWGWQALKRSHSLGKSFYWRNFGVIFLCTFLVEIASIMIGLAMGAIVVAAGLPLAAGTVAANLLSLLMGPLIPISTVLLYYDLRARKEAYDSAALAEDLRH